MAVCPVNSLGNQIQGDSSRGTQSGLNQLKPVTTIHEGPLQFYIICVIARVCEEHVSVGDRIERSDKKIELKFPLQHTE